MSSTDQLLNPGVAKREVVGWAMYDFANSGYTTVVLTAVFNTYFVGVVAGRATWATLAWTGALALSSLIVMLTMPALGAYADLHAAKKRLLALSTLGCVAGTVALAWTGPGDWWWAVFAIVVSNVCFTYGESLIAAFLPEIARHGAMGRVSAWGWSFGYLGGMLALGLSLAYVIQADAGGQPASQYVPVTMWITAAIYGLASLATFALLRERAQPQAGAAVRWGAAFARLADTWRHARRYRDFMWLLACAVFYQAGIAVVVALAAVYAQEALGFTPQQTMMLIFLVNIAAALGALALGYWQDKVGPKRALALALCGCVAMTLMAYAATGPGLFWAAAVVAGLCLGSSLSVGRALVGLLAPQGHQAEFFALWTFAGRAAAVLGPVTYGLVTWMTHNDHRMAILSTGACFVVGLLLLRPLDVERGRRAVS